MNNIENVCRADMKGCRACNRCGTVQKLDCFYKRLDKEARCKKCVSELRRLSYSKNKEAILNRVKRYREENPEKIRDTKLKQAYGVGAIYYNAKLIEQGKVCAGCKRDRKDTWRGKKVEMPLDHNHKTLAPRGVLCSKCNRGLGLLEENLETLLNLVDYIRKYQK